VVTANQVVASMVMFMVVYLLLFAVFLFLLNDKIQHGPDEGDLQPAGKMGARLPSRREVRYELRRPDLHTVWFALVGVLFAGYVILDGFDLGVGILHLLSCAAMRSGGYFLMRSAQFGTATRFGWSRVEGALFAAFPAVYATVFSGFYLAFMALLCALIFRAVANRVFAASIGRCVGGILGSRLRCRQSRLGAAAWCGDGKHRLGCADRCAR